MKVFFCHKFSGKNSFFGAAKNGGKKVEIFNFFFKKQIHFEEKCVLFMYILVF